MAERGRGLPVGLIVAAPPVVAALYFGLWLLMAGVGHWGASDVLTPPFEWFDEAVFEPLYKMVGVERLDFWSHGMATFLLVFGLVWVGSFFVAGLLLGALAALVNAVVLGGGGDGRKG